MLKGLLVGLRVSSRSPPTDRTTRTMPRFDRSASMDSSSAVLRASLSGLVTVSTSPSRKGETLGELDPLGDASDLFAEDGFLRHRPAAGLWSGYGVSREIVVPLTL
jgi:hypothetical protein